jgi:hypothetical protein
MANTFGEYPYLTLNAYNPWALVQDENGGSMAQNLGWVRDAPFVDELGRSYAGFSVGPFQAGAIVMAGLAAILLAGLAFVAWQWARSLEEQSDSVLERQGRRPAAGRGLTWRVYGACLAPPVVAVLLAGQIRVPVPAANVVKACCCDHRQVAMGGLATTLDLVGLAIRPSRSSSHPRPSLLFLRSELSCWRCPASAAATRSWW